MSRIFTVPTGSSVNVTIDDNFWSDFGGFVWQDSITYQVNNIISYDGIFYKCLQISKNKNPLTETSYWTKYQEGFVKIGSTTINLGATETTLKGLTSVTSTTFVGNLTGTASGNLTSSSTLDATKLSGTATINTTGSSGSCTGNASSATYASKVTLTADNSTNATNYPLFANAVTGNLSPRTDTGFTYNPSTGAVTSTTFVGNLTGTASGNLTSSSTLDATKLSGSVPSASIPSATTSVKGGVIVGSCLSVSSGTISADITVTTNTPNSARLYSQTQISSYIQSAMINVAKAFGFSSNTELPAPTAFKNPITNTVITF